MKDTLKAACRLAFSGAIPAWLWILYLIGYLPFALIELYPAPASNSDRDNWYLVLGIAGVTLSIWTYWLLSRKLVETPMNPQGSFGGWFLWTFLFGLLFTGGAEIMSYMIGHFDEEAGYWSDAFFRLILSTAALPFLVHAMRRASRLAHITLQDTLENGRAVFDNLRSAYFIFSIFPILCLHAIPLIAENVSSPAALAGIAFVNWALLTVSSIGETAIAALGHHQIESRIAEQLPSTPSLM